MKKILIIEDHSDMRELLCWQIELMGFTPITARQGKEGVEMALSGKARTDHFGYHDARDGRLGSGPRQIRAHDDMKTIPILAATALFRDADLSACTAAGCNGYIVKPFTFQELQRKVREMIPSVSTTFPL